MKRLVSTLCGLVLGVAVVPAVTSAAAGGPYDSVNGSGWRGTVAHPETPATHFEVSARSGPHGVSGSFRSINAGNALLDFRGSVTCLDVVGDHVIVGGVVTSGGAAGQVGTGFAIGFIDSSSPTPDTVTFSDVALATPVDCGAESFLFTLMTFPVLRGNVVVNDAP